MNITEHFNMIIFLKGKLNVNVELPSCHFAHIRTPTLSTFLPGGGGAPYNGEVPPERGTFFRLQVYKREVISRAQVYEREGKSVIILIWVFKRAFRDCAIITWRGGWETRGGA